MRISWECSSREGLNLLPVNKKAGVMVRPAKSRGQVFHCANILFITINDRCYAKFRVEEAVTDLNPHRPGRAQLRHPVPHSD